MSPKLSGQMPMIGGDGEKEKRMNKERDKVQMVSASDVADCQNNARAPSYYPHMWAESEGSRTARTYEDDLVGSG